MTSIKLSRGEIFHELRLPLIANAIFGIAMGSTLLSVPGVVGDWLGLDIDGWLRVMGALVLGHALFMVHRIDQKNASDEEMTAWIEALRRFIGGN